jgi:hypothetical protein
MAIRNPYVHTVHIHMEIPYGFSISIRLMDRKPASSLLLAGLSGHEPSLPSLPLP